MYITDGDRYQFMRDCVARTTGLVANVGCHTDGAGLKAMAPDRVLNCDIAVQPGFNYHVDRLFDARETWPFENQELELVVMGDILEHFFDNELELVLEQARWSAERICITVPHDVYLEDHIDPDAGYKAHCNTIDEARIREALNTAGFIQINEFHTVRNVGSPKESDMFLIEAE